MLVATAPAVAKPSNLYPVSCSVLWAAVKGTLENPHNYVVVSSDDLRLRTSFVVVGNLTQYTDKVALTAADGGCALKATILEVGSFDGDWLQFHHRLDRSLAKLQAAKPKQSAMTIAEP
jgi:hypothetical protein